jgi:hypothetical protein
MKHKKLVSVCRAVSYATVNLFSDTWALRQMKNYRDIVLWFLKQIIDFEAKPNPWRDKDGDRAPELA